MKNTEDVSVARNIASDDPTVIQKISYMDLLKLITELPTGFRTVFNMYVIEGIPIKRLQNLSAFLRPRHVLSSSEPECCCSPG